jgi:hypothetical protein
MQTAILIGIGAGLASAILFASAWTGTVLGLFVLFFMSPMPVAIAGLGWGWGAGTVAAASGAASIVAGGGVRSAVVYLAALGAPAAVLSYLALLNRPAEAAEGTGAVEWYPIGRMVAWATLWAGLVAAAGLLTIGSDFASVRAALLDMLEKTIFLDAGSAGGGKVTPEQKQAFAGLMTAFLPWAFATTWFTVAILNLWVAGHVTARSGRLIRPWPDLSTIVLPAAMPLGFGAAVIGMMLPDMPGLVSAAFASALLFAFMLVGLGILHRLTRGFAVRPFLLAAVYGGLIFLPPFSNLIVALVGVAEPFLRRRLPPPAGQQGPD